jgi:hypothetical protein
MTYTPEWGTIDGALESVAAVGLPEERAKQALCREISDGRIGIRQLLAPDRRRKLPAQTCKGLLNSARILPEDIDWRRSRPSRPSPAWANSPLMSGPGSFLSVAYGVHNLVERNVESIEVRVADVARIFSTSESPVEAKPAEDSLERRPRRGKKTLAVWQAENALWPEGIPEGLSINDRDRQIIDWLTAKKLSIPDKSTIRRALAIKPADR